VLRGCSFFRTTIKAWRFTTRARRLGGADEDSVHAIDNALATEDAGEDPDRWLLIGPDRAGNCLEVVVMIPLKAAGSSSTPCPMRDEYLRLLGL
jgi:hypothetical protein